MPTDEIIKLVAALGIGSGASAIATAIIAARSSKGKSRAEAADLLIGAAERVGKMNADLDEEVRILKSTVDEIQGLIFLYLGGELSREELIDRMKEVRKR